jgi:hypothetical protein
MAEPEAKQTTGLPDSIATALTRRVAGQMPVEISGRSIKLNFATMDEVLAREIRTNPAMSSLPEMKPEQVAALRAKIKADYGSATVPLPFEPSVTTANPNSPYRYAMVTPNKVADLSGIVDPEIKLQAHAKWQTLKHAIEISGGSVEVFDTSKSDQGGIREVFSRDRYFMHDDIAYLPDIKKYEQLGGMFIEDMRGEIDQAEKFLKERGIKTVKVDDAWFEGGNLVTNAASRTIFMGLEQDWDNSGSSQKLIAAINAHQKHKWDMMGVPLSNQGHLFHLDLGMSQELPNGEHLLSPHVTDKDTFKAIQERIGDKKIILLTDERDTSDYSANLAVASRTNLVMNAASDTLKSDLKARGYTPVLPDQFGQYNFLIASGGPDCQTNTLPQVKPAAATP